uniref:Disease resistance protein Gpa2 n=1 Tax=Solanum tuberosum TaxID=4113 RepID=M1B376_SOLTU
MAYAAITCLMRTIQQSIQLTGCNLQSFYEKFESLRAILEKHMGDLDALKSLEAEIIELVCTTEDILDLESRNVKNPISRIIAFWKLHSLLKQAVGRIDSTMNKWMEMQNMYTKRKDEEAHNLDLASTTSMSQHVVEPQDMMVGHENEFEIIMEDQLARGASELEVVSIVGMGGIGKTTLADKIYNDPFIMSHFDIRAKATVLQEYCAKKVLLSLLSSTNGKIDEHQDDGQLADRLQKSLKGRRYLVVIDDIWTEQAWDDIKLCFPDCNCGSRILLTTRNMEVAEYASSGKPPNQMRLLNVDESWKLLQREVFVKNCFSPEFEQLGKQIALKCGGLPLAIVVIAGLLSKIVEAFDQWTSVAENVSSAVSTDHNVQCMRVLALSYHHLPNHLRVCFLYFAMFPEDTVIFVNKLVKLWAAEGFLKVEMMKSIEEVAEKCVKDLIDRNLIFVHSEFFHKGSSDKYPIKAIQTPMFLPPLGTFPKNLKKLAFTGTRLHWEDLEILGKLPKLEALKLGYDACIGTDWEVGEEGFPHLKFLQLKHLYLHNWGASSDHFPRLERLVINRCWSMYSIPQDFVDITTLQLIHISDSAKSVGNSAKKIQQEIEDNYGSSVEIELEQYPTGAHIASRMLYTAENSFEDVNSKVVADFGCGCGTLGLAAGLLGAESVIGLDIDAESLEIAYANADELELDMDFMQCDISNLKWRGQIVETVVMNPPFGTRRKGADMDFLSSAMKLRYDVPQLYKFHKKKEVDIAVDLWRFVPQRKQERSL